MIINIANRGRACLNGGRALVDRNGELAQSSDWLAVRARVVLHADFESERLRADRIVDSRLQHKVSISVEFHIVDLLAKLVRDGVRLGTAPV